MSQELFEGDPNTQPVTLRPAGVEDLRPEYANIIHINFDSDAFQLVFSRFTQPVAASEEEKTATRERGTYPIPAVARVLLPINVARQLHTLLESQLARYDAAIEALNEAESSTSEERTESA